MFAVLAMAYIIDQALNSSSKVTETCSGCINNLLREGERFSCETLEFLDIKILFN